MLLGQGGCESEPGLAWAPISLEPLWGVPKELQASACGVCGSALVPGGCLHKQDSQFMLLSEVVKYFFHWIV